MPRATSLVRNSPPEGLLARARAGTGRSVNIVNFRAVLCVLLLVVGVASPAHADSWANPVVREIFSANRDHFVRVTPGASWGDTMGFAGAPKGAFATAEYYRRHADKSYRLMQTVTLLNPVAPVDVFVSDEGRLVTVDNWHNRGYGKVLAVYDAAGRLVKAYALTDLFAKDEIDGAQHSVSSIAWHEGPVYLNRDQRTLYMMIRSGRDLVLGMESGRFAYCEPREGKYLCRNSNEERRWLPYAEAVPER
jgi:hypothetical protein